MTIFYLASMGFAFLIGFVIEIVTVSPYDAQPIKRGAYLALMMFVVVTIFIR
jgi:hypothetical protein